MPRAEFKDRYITTYFSTPEEKQFWEEFAKAHGATLSKLIHEALATLKQQESVQPRPDKIKELEALKEELQTARRELKLREELLKRYESELYRIRHAGFEAGSSEREGSRRHDLDLIQLLKTGKTLDSSEILEGLGIDPNDNKALKLVWGQLESLQKYNLVHETRFGWRWSK